MEENIAITPESNELISKNEWVLIWRRLRAKKLAMISLVLIVIIYGAGLFAPLVAPYSLP